MAYNEKSLSQAFLDQIGLSESGLLEPELPVPPRSATVFPRHISADGCQFVLEGALGAVLPKGQRIRFLLEERAVTGRISWVVSDRAGVAFDAPLLPVQQCNLRRRAASGGGLALYCD